MAVTYRVAAHRLFVWFGILLLSGARSKSKGKQSPNPLDFKCMPLESIKPKCRACAKATYKVTSYVTQPAIKNHH